MATIGGLGYVLLCGITAASAGLLAVARRNGAPIGAVLLLAALAGAGAAAALMR
jgi:hypothetical protein